MNYFVQYMTEFTAKDALIHLFLFLFCLKQASELLSWFFSKTGIETKTMRKHKDAVDKLEKHENMLDDLNNKIDEINQKLSKLSDKIIDNEKTMDYRRMRELRRTILDFANGMAKRQYDKEMCDDIFDNYEEYEGLLLKWNETNGRTARAMDAINRYYQTLPMQ